MVRSFSLSLAAVDIVFDHLELGRAPFPFEVPTLGETFTERAQIRQAVFRDLEGRGLVRGGRFNPDAEAALRTFVGGRVAVTAAATLDDGKKLFARSATDGRLAVVGKRDGNFLVFTEIRPVGLVPEIVNLIPATRPAPGQSVTLAKPDTKPGRHAAPDCYDPFADVSAPAARASVQERAVERMFDKPQRRFGQFTAFAHDGRGPAEYLDPVAWFDTDDGRVFTTRRVTEDGQAWLTFAPADNARIVQHLHSQVQPYLRG
ncbi:ESX secretion-associated protein EspG [Saccharomonospora piscinae]|uniref:ESX secretion-associated protein EspG n=1 Tax=Saccharomonospora piscinae TaxID=687388 RepID=A0A1V9A1C9_SACPI|nr:ESX secretion-associated protein EspG [Saccharomonospora piscinae]OQO90836.1 ESX secretion-associated protein EspG [Saccharomonospora piscinae]